MKTDNRREQIIDIIKKEFIGPDPINVKNLIQSDGEEIIQFEPPHMRYSAGILFPKEISLLADNNDKMNDLIQKVNEDENEFIREAEEKSDRSLPRELGNDWEEVVNLSNAFHQSSISLTACLDINDNLIVKISAGQYQLRTEYDENLNKNVSRYYRRPIENSIIIKSKDFPDKKSKVKYFEIISGETKTNLLFLMTFRYLIKKTNFTIFTFSLLNSKTNEDNPLASDDKYYQVEFEILSEKGFSPLKGENRINLNDEDYQSNLLLYRNVRNYGIGHGCSVEWKEDELHQVKKIKTSILPVYEVKPIIPVNFEDIVLDMIDLSDLGDFQKSIINLDLLYKKYYSWIQAQWEEYKSLPAEYKKTAERHLKNCEICLERLAEGIRLVQSDEIIKKAFQYMNRAMILQQLHYNLPLQDWIEDKGSLHLQKKVNQLPQIDNKDTWYGDNKKYGKWRPFQIAFILMNINSIFDKEADERKIVDLIWFPTGGGKTEAYLGMSAFTIFLRRLRDPMDDGTTVLMRYTLRLLTAQQYERASSLICACELIRREKQQELGESRITIGLWVGNSLTPNKNSEACNLFNKICRSEEKENPFIVIKCPWCGAKMGPVRINNNITKMKGYRKIINKTKKIVFQCENPICDFSTDNFNLPLYVIDEMIYDNPPSLLIGTVDKFAILPFKPETRKIFGISETNSKSPPDLIIQDELHLISGPLGSMVGHYETLIKELCITRDQNCLSPKIIVSTATISHAKEQCNNLYDCGIENIFQFPASGINYNDSFFSKEDKDSPGRIFMGILAPASSSFTTTGIRLYATLLYAAKELKVNDEKERDPYWTNLGYYNSLRELGQTLTWISADIQEYLQSIYLRKMYHKKENYKSIRRYIYRYEELTSRIKNDEVPQILQELSISYPPENNRKLPIDICLATNMISVGVDILRLGLMTVTGQPKTTSEYIQATSRVGRNPKAPGLILTLYNPGKPRDKSHYEDFQQYHSKLYFNVEPTSVSPFSSPVRERALHALLVGLIRLFGSPVTENDPKKIPDQTIMNKYINIILDRISRIDSSEKENARDQLNNFLEDWKRWLPYKYSDFTSGDDQPLIYASGINPNPKWEGRGKSAPTSMRDVDLSSEVFVLLNQYSESDGDEI